MSSSAICAQYQSNRDSRKSKTQALAHAIRASEQSALVGGNVQGVPCMSMVLHCPSPASCSTQNTVHLRASSSTRTSPNEREEPSMYTSVEPEYDIILNGVSRAFRYSHLPCTMPCTRTQTRSIRVHKIHTSTQDPYELRLGC
jgi:hypothetical protein